MSDSVDVLSGLTKRTESLESLITKISKQMTDMPKMMVAMVGAVSGDKDVLKKFFTDTEKFHKAQTLRAVIDKDLPKNMESIIKFLKEIRDDADYQKKEHEIDKKYRSADRKAQSGKSAMGAVGGEMLMKNPFFKALLGGKIKDQRERYDTGRENLKYGRDSLKENNLDVTIAKVLGKMGLGNKGGDGLGVGSEDETGGGGEGKSLRFGENQRKNQRDKKANRGKGGGGGNGGGGGGLLAELLQYGEGKVETTETEVARIPFALSGGPILLHGDLKEIKDSLADMAEQEKWKQNKGKGGGGILDLLKGAGVLEAIGAALPIVAGVAIAAGLVAILIAAIASERAKRDAANNAAFNALSKEDQAKVDSASGMKPEYKNGDVLALTSSAPGTQKEKEQKAKVLLTSGSRDTPGGGSTDDELSIAYETLGLFTKGRRKFESGGLFGVPTIKLDSGYSIAIGKLSDKDKDKLMKSSYPQIEGTSIEKGQDWQRNAKKLNGESFDNGTMFAHRAGYKKGEHFPAMVAEGEGIIPSHKNNFLESMQGMLKSKDNTKVLEDLIREQTGYLKNLVDKTEEGNKLLTKGNEPAPPTKEKTVATAARTKLGDS